MRPFCCRVRVFIRLKAIRKFKLTIYITGNLDGSRDQRFGKHGKVSLLRRPSWLRISSQFRRVLIEKGEFPALTIIYSEGTLGLVECLKSNGILIQDCRLIAMSGKLHPWTLPWVSGP